jgi:hypothetical protein
MSCTMGSNSSRALKGTMSTFVGATTAGSERTWGCFSRVYTCL